MFFGGLVTAAFLVAVVGAAVYMVRQRRQQGSAQFDAVAGAARPTTTTVNPTYQNPGKSLEFANPLGEDGEDGEDGLLSSTSI